MVESYAELAIVGRRGSISRIRKGPTQSEILLEFLGGFTQNLPLRIGLSRCVLKQLLIELVTSYRSSLQDFVFI